MKNQSSNFEQTVIEWFIEQIIKSLWERIESLEQIIKSLWERIESLEQIIKSLWERIESLETDFQNHKRSDEFMYPQPNFDEPYD